MKLAAILALLLGATAAEASVVTLEPGRYPLVSYAVDEGDSRPILGQLQSGFHYDQGAYEPRFYVIYLSDDSGFAWGSVLKRRDRRRFDLIDATMSAGSNAYKSADSPPPVPTGNAYLDREAHWAWAANDPGATPTTYPTLLWQGYRGGKLVAEWQKPQGASGTLTFDAAFSDLDKVVVSLDVVGYAQSFLQSDPGGIFSITEPNSYWCWEWCFDGAVQQMTLHVPGGHLPPAPVPVPAGLPLLAAGLGLLAGLRHRVRAQAGNSSDPGCAEWVKRSIT